MAVRPLACLGRLQQKLEEAERYMTAALSEAIKGFGADDPHTAAARQNLAEQYRVMRKYVCPVR